MSEYDDEIKIDELYKVIERKNNEIKKLNSDNATAIQKAKDDMAEKAMHIICEENGCTYYFNNKKPCDEYCIKRFRIRAAAKLKE